MNLDSDVEHHLFRGQMLARDKVESILIASPKDIIDLSELQAIHDIPGTAEEISAFLQQDDRFCVVAEGDEDEREIFVILKSTEFDADRLSAIKQSAERWRNSMFSFLFDEKAGSKLALSVLNSFVPRPLDLPSKVKMKAVLMTDTFHRFVVADNGNIVHLSGDYRRHTSESLAHRASLGGAGMVKSYSSIFSAEMNGYDQHRSATTPIVHSPAVEEAIEEWRCEIASYLQEQDSDQILICTIGSAVHRPAGLPASMKLLDTLRSDSSRFNIRFVTAVNQFAVTLKPTEVELALLKERWRLRIADYLLTKMNAPGAAPNYINGKKSSTSIYLSDLGTLVKRPSQLFKSLSIKELIETDPHRRFKLEGSGNEVRVRIRPGYAVKDYAQQVRQLEHSEREARRHPSSACSDCSVPSVDTAATATGTTTGEDSSSWTEVVGRGLRPGTTGAGTINTGAGGFKLSRKDAHSLLLPDHQQQQPQTVAPQLYSSHAAPYISTLHDTVMFQSGHMAPPGLQPLWINDHQSAGNSGIPSVGDSNSTATAATPHHRTVGSGGGEAAMDSWVKVDPLRDLRGGGDGGGGIYAKWEDRHTSTTTTTNCAAWHTQASLQQQLHPSFATSPSPSPDGLSHGTRTTRNASTATATATLVGAIGNGTGTGTPSYHAGGAGGGGEGGGGGFLVSALSSLKPATATTLATLATASTTAGGASALAPVRSPDTDLSLQEWFPSVFLGFESSLIEFFTVKMHEEGYLTVSDLIIAESFGSLSFETLSETAGMKRGHYNRLVMGLNKFKSP